MPNVTIFFNYTKDGVEWHPLNTTLGYTYNGGANEVGWSFTLDGTLWGVLRNEDGDSSG